MISVHPSHSTPLPVGFRTWRYTLYSFHIIHLPILLRVVGRTVVALYFVPGYGAIDAETIFMSYHHGASRYTLRLMYALSLGWYVAQINTYTSKYLLNYRVTSLSEMWYQSQMGCKELNGNVEDLQVDRPMELKYRRWIQCVVKIYIMMVNYRYP